MKMEFEGLDELMKTIEKVASDAEIKKVDKEIIKESAQVVKNKLRPKVRKSSDPNKSGIKGMKTGKHAADNIEISKIKTKKGKMFILVGWEYDKEFGYMQWEEWGNTTREPKPVLYPTVESSQAQLSSIAAKHYKNLIEKVR